MKDLHNSVEVRRTISPQSVANNTTIYGQVIDRNGYDALEFVIALGNLADSDATFSVKVQESDNENFASCSAVADANLLGLESAAAWTYASDDLTRRIGVANTKRYVRIVVTPSGNSAAALLAVVAVLAYPKVGPASYTPDTGLGTGSGSGTDA